MGLFKKNDCGACGEKIDSRDAGLTIRLSRQGRSSLGRRSVRVDTDCVNRNGLLASGGKPWQLNQDAVNKTLGI